VRVRRAHAATSVRLDPPVSGGASKNRRPPAPPSPAVCASNATGSRAAAAPLGGEGKGTPLGIELPLTSRRRRLRVYTSGLSASLGRPGRRRAAGAARTPRYYYLLRRVCRRRCWLAAGAVIDGYYLLQVGARLGAGEYLLLARRCGRHVRPREIETWHHHHLLPSLPLPQACVNDGHRLGCL